MEDESIFTKKQPKEISEGLQRFIDSMVEEIVLEGKPFDSQKKYLKKFSENEGLDYDKLEADITTFIEILDNIKKTPNKLMEKYAVDKGHECFISDTVIAKLLEIAGYKSLSFIEWGSIDKVEFRYGDCSVPPRYHRSYTISITSNEKTLVVDCYGSVLLTRNYSNNQKNFEKFKETLANVGIYTHDIVRDERDGITTLYLKLYDGSECVFSRYTTNTEGKYGNMYLPKESVVLFHNEIPESVGNLIQETSDKTEKEIEAKEEERFFANCSSKADYMEYLRNYPNGRYVNAANIKMKEFDTASEEKASKQIDEDGIWWLGWVAAIVGAILGFVNGGIGMAIVFTLAGFCLGSFVAGVISKIME